MTFCEDLELAFILYVIGAKDNLADAQAKVAEWQEKGVKVPQNLEAAQFWRKQEDAQRIKDARPMLTFSESIENAVKSQRNQPLPMPLHYLVRIRSR